MAKHIKNLVDESVAKEFELRHDLFQWVKDIEEEKGDMEVEKYVDPNFRRIYDFVKHHKVKPVADSDDIHPIEATIYATRTNEEPIGVILVDIILETLGIALVERDLIQQFFENEQRAKEIIDGIVMRITTKQWTEVVELFDALLALLMSAEFLARLGRYLNESVGANRAAFLMGRIAKNLVVRLVPFVGWVYLGISFAISVRKNFDRFPRDV